MSAMTFQSLFLQDPWTRQGKRVNFDPSLTVIRGGNQTGKSAILTSLYRCFGAEPAILDAEWQAAGIYTALLFESKGRAYYLFHAPQLYALFDDQKRLVQEFPRGIGLAPQICRFLELHESTVLTDDRVTPGSLLAPFYMDQEVSWRRPWSGFRNLGDFGQNSADLAELLLGTKTARYFSAQDRLSRAHAREHEVKLLERGLLAVDHTLAGEDYRTLTFDAQEDAFKTEIQALTVRSQALRERQERFRHKFVELSQSKRELELRHAVANAAANEAREDYEFAHGLAEKGVIRCPTCGTEHRNSFRERFSIAADEDDCRAMAVRLLGSIRAIEREIERLQVEYNRSEHDFTQISQILSRRIGHFEFADYVKNRGQETLREIVKQQRAAVYSQIGEIEREIASDRDLVERHQASATRKKLLSDYHRLLSDFLSELGVSRSTVDTQSSEGFGLQVSLRTQARGLKGSVLPRTLLAYHFALLHLLRDSEAMQLAPMVIDSPHQQDQDAATRRAVLRFIRDARPKGQQVILALASDSNVELPGRKISLSRKKHLLDPAEYAAVSDELRPLMAQLSMNRMLW